MSDLPDVTIPMTNTIELPPPTRSTDDPPWAATMTEPAWGELSDWERHELRRLWREAETRLREVVTSAADRLWLLHDGSSSSLQTAPEAVADRATRYALAVTRLSAVMDGCVHRWHSERKP